ncbi:unnamed protein product [Oppiella nova]|uniref:Uncharacterized protein n=1 Tax=Oppiella nova TaxID=334625 RepID=A0A7R9MME4_9ACAR|nr:unnamed protein product [Oppiella nova]CAG2179682.1 unnamed protein product [Oppiella nova]
MRFWSTKWTSRKSIWMSCGRGFRRESLSCWRWRTRLWSNMS